MHQVKSGGVDDGAALCLLSEVEYPENAPWRNLPVFVWVGEECLHSAGKASTQSFNQGSDTMDEMVNDGFSGEPKSLDVAISAIPGDDWWKQASEDTYKTAARTMLKRGMTAQEVYDMLSNLYWAAAECYGG